MSSERVLSQLLNEASDYHINPDQLQTALDELEYETKMHGEEMADEATDYTPITGGDPWEKSTVSEGSQVTNNEEEQQENPQPEVYEPIKLPSDIFTNPPESIDYNPYNFYDKVKQERLNTPQYLIPNDPILSNMGSFDYFETDDNSSISQQAVEFMNKLVIQRNAFIDTNSWVDTTKDFYDYDDINMAGITQKPTSFIVIGKPGIGLTTFAEKFARKMNLVYISPSASVDYFKTSKEFSDKFEYGGWEDTVIFDFICKRMQALDVHHRGYILDGWPIIRSEEIPIADQIGMLKLLPYHPDFVFIMQMEDKDLFRRRVDQKLDPLTMQVYIKKHYIRSSVASINLEGVTKELASRDGSVKTSFDLTINTSSVGKLGGKSTSTELDLTSDGNSQDFQPLDLDVVGRLISRLEDHPAQVERDFEKYRKAVPVIQAFINSWDRTKIFELDAYWAPSTIMKNAMSIMKALGIIPACTPMEIFRPIKKPKNTLRPEDEGEGYSSGEDEGCIPDPNDPETIKELEDQFPPDWTAVMRAVVVRGRIDPRFRWRISKWKNLCPVALKEGRSIAGRPELAYALHDKVYFLSSPESVLKFIFNPRQYLVKSMPCSPIKFFVVGHPLAGKTSFAQSLAQLTGGSVVDMNKQVTKRLECVKQRYLFKTRFETTMAAKKVIDKENFTAWKTDERNRIEKVKKWIADYIRKKAAEEINKALAIDREERMKKYRKMRAKSEYHELSSAFKSSPCTADRLSFSWKKFVKDIRKGKDTWALQEQLELAWDLFRQGKLRYKSKKKGPQHLRRLKRKIGEEPGEGEEESVDGEEKSDEDDEDESEEEESVGEEESSSEEEDKKKRRRRKKKPYCKKAKPAEVVVVQDEEEVQSELSSEDEPDEYLQLRYPEMCLELTESVPRPPPVCDLDERIQALVKTKVEETEKWVNTLPSEIYEEILQMGLRDAQEYFQQRFPYAHFSGGWIVENLILDVEKWRSILRNPGLCPDQVFVLQDTSPDHVKITNTLKKLFVAAHPSRKISMRKKRMGDLLAEDDVDLVPELSPQKSFQTFAFEFIESNSAVNQKDDLEGRPCSTESSARQMEIDRKRQQSRVTSATSDSSAIFYKHLPNKPAFDGRAVCKDDWTPPGEPSKFQFSSDISIPEECLKPWHTVVSEKKLGLSPLPKSKIIPCDMRVVLDYEKAIDLALNPHRPKSGGDTLAGQSQVFNFQYGEEEGEWEFQDEGMTGKYPKSQEFLVHSKFGEISGEDQEPEIVRTPTGMNSLADICIPGEQGEDGDHPEKCKDGTPSVKKTFLRQITLFDDFWNMIYPVMTKEKIKYWEVGVVDELTVKDKAQKFWDELESRFKLPPQKVTDGDLEEEDADVAESEFLWTKHKPTKKKAEHSEENPGEFDDDDEDDDDEGGESEKVSDEEMSDEEEDYMGRTNDSLKKLEGKPEEYRVALNDIERNRLFGNYKYFCPVTLHDLQLVRKGSPKFAVTYQNRLYYMVSAEAMERFMKEPHVFLSVSSRKCIPPPRICITGAPACGQNEVARKMAEKAGIYYVNFRDRLHEIMKGRLGHDIGPQFTGDIVTNVESEASTPKSGSEEDSDAEESGKKVRRKKMEEEEEKEEEEEEEFDPNTEWIKEKKERKEMELKARKSLGMMENVNVVSYPMDSIPRVETKAEQSVKTRKLTETEKHIQAFLESGAQLPPSVLDEFIPPLWNEEPFKSKGFILVGFPNTPKDIQYMTGKNCWPEQVYIMDCKKKTCKNRLMRQTLELCSRRRKIEGGHRERKKKGPPTRAKISPGEYHGLPPKEEEETAKSMLPFRKKIGKALFHYHYMYSRKINAMKIDLNQRRIEWASFKTDLSLFDSKNRIVKAMTPSLRYRENIFEVTYVLHPEEAEALLQKRYFHLSRLKRWCPVEISKGNTGINLWNAPGVTKYPVLYRNYIYFIAGEEHLEHFRDNVIAMSKQKTPTPIVPFHLVVVGPPKSGKTEISKRIARELGLLYVEETAVIDRMIDHANAGRSEYENFISLESPQPMGFSQKVDAYLKRGHSIPPYMFYRSLDFMLLEPLAQYHGVVFDGYPLEDISIQELLERGVIPSVVELDIDLETALHRCEKERRIPDYDFRGFVQDCDELVTIQFKGYGPMKSPCLFWYASHMKCMVSVKGTRNPAEICKEVEKKCKAAQVTKQKSILDLINNRTFQPSLTTLK